MRQKVAFDLEDFKREDEAPREQEAKKRKS